MCDSLQRFPCLRVKIIGMVSGTVRTDQHAQCRMYMGLRFFPVNSVSGYLAGPIQQRQIQKAVDNQPVISRLIWLSPCLQELPLLMKTLQKPAGRLNCGFLRLLAAGQLPGRHTGWRIQKSKIMGIRLNLMIDAVPKGLGLRKRRPFHLGITGTLICQPQLSRPEAVGPLVIWCFRVKVIGTENMFEPGSESGHGKTGLGHGCFEGLLQFRRSQLRIVL